MRSSVYSLATHRVAGSLHLIRPKVFAWFAARGKPARTEQQLAQDAQARYMAEMLKLSENPDEDNTGKMMEVMMMSGAAAQWSQPFATWKGSVRSATS